MRAARIALALGCACLAAALGAAPAAADFGLKGLGVEFEKQGGAPEIGAGTHPFALTTTLEVNTTTDPDFGEVPDEAVRDLVINFPAGMVGNPTAVPQCSSADFANVINGGPSCSAASAIGVARLTLGLGYGAPSPAPPAAVYNLVPAPGTAAKIGFVALGVPVTADLLVNPNPPHNVIAVLEKIAQPVRFYGSEVEIWGNPASPVHDDERGTCATSPTGTCPVSLPEKPFLTTPRSCSGPLAVSFAADSWQNPGEWVGYQVQTPFGMSGCAALGFSPTISSQPTTQAAESPSGLSFELDVDDPGLTSATGTADSDIKKAVVTLPEGVTVNPGVAEGLATCTEADLARESAFSAPGEGCPQASKVGEVEVETPLLEGKLLRGQLYVATQEANPFGSLLAIYMVIADPELGISVKLAGRVDPDPATGQLITTFGEAGQEIPQFPFSHFRFRFREGARAPLITPARCGTYTTTATFTPWANPSAPYTTSAEFTISTGPNGTPCPVPGPLPFTPGFEAGSLDNAAGSYSPFYMRLTRPDGQQDLTRFDAVLPPGVVGKIAGLARCADAAIAAAGARSARAELAAPSCPASSLIGRTLAGAGAGSALTWVPGSLYLAGPYGGAPLSVVAITPALAGPFDAGTVVVREALRLNPVSAQVEVDGAASDPIPHILKGIPLHLRELRVFTDRPEFTLNPTSCEPTKTLTALFGSYLQPLSPADDQPAYLDARYQAASCASLGFRPKLDLRLKGGTRRSAHPALRAELKARPGDANVGAASVLLPRSAFLENAHIGTICTRERFAADDCPKGSVYGRARAFTPLLDEPLEGPVYLRSNGGARALPDLVADLRGVVDIELVGYVDSVNARIRTRFLTPPDAPVTRFVLNMKGGKKSLIANSANLCKAKQRATANMRGQNGRRLTFRPLVRALGCKQKKAKSSSDDRRR